MLAFSQFYPFPVKFHLPEISAPFLFALNYSCSSSIPHSNPISLFKCPQQQLSRNPWVIKLVLFCHNFSLELFKLFFNILLLCFFKTSTLFLQLGYKILEIPVFSTSIPMFSKTTSMVCKE